MIVSLFGKVVNIDKSFIELEVNNIGYEIELPLSDIVKLIVGHNIKIFTQLVVREDAHLLFGFLECEVRSCFRQLIKVSGIGAKTALMILSQLTLLQLQAAIDEKDIAVLSAVPGIGKKTAERLLVELADKILHHGTVSLNVQAADSNLINTHNIRPIIKLELSQVLEQFGYNGKQIEQIIKQLPANIDDTANAVKWALQQV